MRRRRGPSTFCTNRHLSPPPASNINHSRDDELAPREAAGREVSPALGKAKRQPEKLSDLLKVTQSRSSGGARPRLPGVQSRASCFLPAPKSLSPFSVHLGPSLPRCLLHPAARGSFQILAPAAGSPTKPSQLTWERIPASGSFRAARSQMIPTT